MNQLIEAGWTLSEPIKVYEVVKATSLVCQKAKGGKNPLWHCRHISYFSDTDWRGQPLAKRSAKVRICGAGNTADNAIKDWQKQYRAVCTK
jgi:hypothetical protein